jgi:hypothetical protein
MKMMRSASGGANAASVLFIPRSLAAAVGGH